MIWMWSATTFNLYTMNFYLKYIPGGKFVNFSMAGGAEVLANIFIGIVFKYLQVKWSFFVGYCLAAAGGVCLIFQAQFENSDLLIATFVLLGKFGIAMAQCTCFIATPWLFPIQVNATAFGICNLVGRLFALAAPIVAEFESPLPMMIFSVACAISILLSFFIQQPKGE